MELLSLVGEKGGPVSRDADSSLLTTFSQHWGGYRHGRYTSGYTTIEPDFDGGKLLLSSLGCGAVSRGVGSSLSHRYRRRLASIGLDIATDDVRDGN